jgi:hypothetical protein
MFLRALLVTTLAVPVLLLPMFATVGAAADFCDRDRGMGMMCPPLARAVAGAAAAMHPAAPPRNYSFTFYTSRADCLTGVYLLQAPLDICDGPGPEGVESDEETGGLVWGNRIE